MISSRMGALAKTALKSGQQHEIAASTGTIWTATLRSITYVISNVMKRSGIVEISE